MIGEPRQGFVQCCRFRRRLVILQLLLRLLVVAASHLSGGSDTAGAQDGSNTTKALVPLVVAEAGNLGDKDCERGRECERWKTMSLRC